MAKTFWCSGNTVGSASDLRFSGPCHGSDQPNNSTEANVKVLVAAAGTFSNFSALIDNAAGAGCSIKFRKGGADGNETLAITDGAGLTLYNDATHSDAVVAGDIVGIKLDGGAGFITHVYAVNGIFSATSGTACIYGTGSFATSFANGGSPCYACPGGQLAVTTTEAQAQFKIKAPGTISKLTVNITSNSQGGSSTFVVRKNGSTQSGIVTFASTATGQSQDPTGSDSFTTDDLLSVLCTPFDSAAFSGASMQATFVSSDTHYDLLGTRSGTIGRAASATAHYPHVGCRPNMNNTTEANGKFQHGFSVDTSYFRWQVDTNTYSADVTVNLRKNGANANQQFTIGHGASGWFVDGTNLDTFAATDDMGSMIVGGSSGTLNVSGTGITEMETGSGAVAGQRGVARPYFF